MNQQRNGNNTKIDKGSEMHYDGSAFQFTHLALAKIASFLSLDALDPEIEAVRFLCRRFWERHL